MPKNTYNELKQLIERLNNIDESYVLTDLYISIEEMLNDHKSRAEFPGDIIGADLLEDLESILAQYKHEALR